MMKSGLRKMRVTENGWKTLAPKDEETTGGMSGEMDDQKEQPKALKRKRSAIVNGQGSTQYGLK